MFRENLIASPRPARGREMKTTKVPGKNFGLMRVLTQKKLQKDGGNIPDQDLFESIKDTPLPSNETGGAYHEVFKPNQKFLVPDTTLREMERIINTIMKPKRSLRFKNETENEYPDNSEILPSKLDAVLERLDDITSETSIYDSAEEFLDIPPDEAIPLSNLDEESQVTPTISSTVFPTYTPLFPIDFEPELSKFYAETHQTSDELKNKRLHYRILGNYTDLLSPKFKIQKLGQDTIYELTEKQDQTNEIEIPKLKMKHPKNQAHLTIAGKLFKKASQGFLNTFFDFTKGEPVDTFNIVNKVHTLPNTASECAFSVSGKFVKGEEKTAIPVLSVHLNKNEAVTSSTIEKKNQIHSKKLAMLFGNEIKKET